jgi:hypothetical protein
MTIEGARNVTDTQKCVVNSGYFDVSCPDTDANARGKRPIALFNLAEPAVLFSG